MSTESEEQKDLDFDPEDAENVMGGMIEGAAAGKTKRATVQGAFEVSGNEAQVERDSL